MREEIRWPTLRRSRKRGFHYIVTARKGHLLEMFEVAATSGHNLDAPEINPITESFNQISCKILSLFVFPSPLDIKLSLKGFTKTLHSRTLQISIFFYIKGPSCTLLSHDKISFFNIWGKCFWICIWIILRSLLSTCRLYRDRQKPADETQCPTITTDS